MQQAKDPSEASMGTTPRGKIRRSRRFSVALWLGGVLLTSLMLLAPSIAAAPLPAARPTLRAPFSGTPLTLRDTIAEDCGTATLSHGPRMSLSSGVGRAEATTSANTSSTCSWPLIPNEGAAVGWFGLSTPNFTASSGSHKIKVAWDLQWTVDLKASGAGANPGSIQTATVIEVEVEVVDVTKGNGVAVQEWEHEINRTGDASVHSVESRNLTLDVTWSFNATHVYTILTVVQFTAVSEVSQGTSSGQASALINLATGGNKATLVSISEP
jgi:hypothetical protein